MIKDDLISVIIPVYNRPVMIKKAIFSVLNQSYKNFELIIADDGSTDETINIIKSFDSDKRIRILYLKHSGLAGFVRNQAVKKAEGKWISFLDSDDIWLKEKLEKQIEYLNKYRDIKFIHTREKWLREGMEVSQNHRKHRKEGDLFKTSLGKCEIGPSTVMIEKELYHSVGGFREDLEICEDYELWLRLTADNLIGYIDNDLVIKNGGHKDQLSTKYGFIEKFKIDALKNLIEIDYFKGLKSILAKEELTKKCRIYSKGCRKRGKIDEAEKYELLIDKLGL